MIDPKSLRPYYSDFLRDDRLLMTGHSHQAWPNVAQEGLLQAYRDAADHVDRKWSRAFAVADGLREQVAQRIGSNPDEIALGANTHELVTRFLSCLDFAARPHIVTTTGEFHSMDRQLRRLGEEDVEVTRVLARPVMDLAQRMAAEVRDTTAAVMVSSVLFETAEIVPGLAELTRAAQRVGAKVLIDAYHAFGVVPFVIADFGPEPVYVTAGGYKYAQWGEGCCFLRVPADCDDRPVFTGWFADFAHLSDRRSDRPATYGERGADRFAGSTYDPSSHYRALRVARFFEEQTLNLTGLRELSLHQTAKLVGHLDGFDVLTPCAPEQRAGFVAIRLNHAQEVSDALGERGIYTDARGDILRLGPAPYTTDDEIERCVYALREVAAP